MRRIWILLSLIIITSGVGAANCPNGQAYYEKVERNNPANVRDRMALSTEISQKLVNKYPDAAVVCRTYKDQFYCLACPKDNS